MATKMSLWRLAADGSATAVSEKRLETEKLIESAVESAPELLGVDVLLIGRQTMTPSGPLDLLGIDSDGRLVVIENKRDRTPRDVLAQAIDYAAWANSLTFAEVAELFAKYRARHEDQDADLAEAFEERFGEELDTIADAPRMIVVASRLDDSTERMIEFLSDSFGVPVNAVLFQPFEDDLIGRTWLRPEHTGRAVGGKRSASNTASRDQSKIFWDEWLPIGRPRLPDVKLPQNGPRSVLINRRIVHGVPASLVIWVSASEAYAEIAFEDDEPAINAAALDALSQHRSEIETAFGGQLEWRRPASSELMTRRTKVVTPKVDIGDRTKPTPEGLQELTAVVRRLVDAVKPHVAAAIEEAVAAQDDSGTDPEYSAADGPLEGSQSMVETS